MQLNGTTTQLGPSKCSNDVCLHSHTGYLILYFNMGYSMKLGTKYVVKSCLNVLCMLKNDVIGACLFSTLHRTYFDWEEGRFVSQRCLEF